MCFCIGFRCRYLSHFRSIHRGAYFAELRTTTVRKLLPESWGFLCPVHTPDGSPCGLLNHFTAACRWVGVGWGGVGGWGGEELESRLETCRGGKGRARRGNHTAAMGCPVERTPTHPGLAEFGAAGCCCCCRVVTHESEEPEEVLAAVTKASAGVGWPGRCHGCTFVPVPVQGRRAMHLCGACTLGLSWQ